MLQGTTRQFEAFIAIVETGSFAAAAERLGISVAATSAHVTSLERKLNCQLFERRPGTTPAPTDKGIELLDHAQNLLQRVSLMATVAGVPTKPRSKVRVGVRSIILEHLFLPNIGRFQVEHPEIQVEFIVVPPWKIEQSMREGRLDLAYFASDEIDPRCPAERICTVSQGLFVAPTHPIAGRYGVAGVRLPMILPLANSGAERMILDVLARSGITDYDVVLRTQHFDTQRELARLGAGVCWQFHEDASDDVQKNRLVDLGAGLPMVPRWAVRRPGATEFDHIRILDEFLSDLLRPGRSRHRH